jgi:Domain of unknown function (DUF1707)
MSWLGQLADGLTARGITGRDRRRIVLELHDHIECEPDCVERLGAPGELAAAFADELATGRARGSAFGAFAALAITAVTLIVSQLTLGRAVGYPGYAHGLSLILFLPALLGMVIAPQVALVAGMLAALRAVRRRRATVLPAAELALIRRRARVAIGAGFATVAGLELYVVNFSAVLPAWWLALTGGLGAVAGGALFAASTKLARAGTLISGAAGEAGDVYDDLPLLRWAWLRRHPWRLGAIASLGATVLMTLFVARAEHSLFEGVQRGLFEGLVAAAGFVLLGRSMGVAASPAGSEERALRAPGGLDGLGPRLVDLPSHRLVADADRARAELALREGFAQGRLSIEELTARLAVIHEAQTIGQLRAALRGLPDSG